MKWLLVVDLQEVRVNISLTPGESTLGKREHRGFETPEGRSLEVDESL
jgi:hypothetical protein